MPSEPQQLSAAFSVPETIWPAGTKWAGLTPAQQRAVAQHTANRLRDDCAGQIRDAYAAFGVPDPPGLTFTRQAAGGAVVVEQLHAAIRATRAGEAGPMWQIAGANGPGSTDARAEILATAIGAALRERPAARSTAKEGGST
jgi:hypothetical protein